MGLFLGERIVLVAIILVCLDGLSSMDDDAFPSWFLGLRSFGGLFRDLTLDPFICRSVAVDTCSN
jgi:hypothetical protein